MSSQKINVKNDRGFSLIELMVVITIIAMLAAVAVPAYKKYIVEAKVANIVFGAGGGLMTASKQLAETTGTFMYGAGYGNGCSNCQNPDIIGSPEGLDYIYIQDEGSPCGNGKDGAVIFNFNDSITGSSFSVHRYILLVDGIYKELCVNEGAFTLNGCTNGYGDVGSMRNLICN